MLFEFLLLIVKIAARIVIKARKKGNAKKEFIFSDIVFPNGKIRSDTFQIFITDKNGHWTGNKSGAMVNFNHYLYRNIKFPIKGEYQFKFNQAMRDTILNEVISLGLKINKLDKQS